MVHCISISILCFTGVGFFITTIILWFAGVVLCCFIGFLFISIVITYFKGVLFIRIGILFFKGVLFISNVILYFISVVFCLSRLVIFIIFSNWYLPLTFKRYYCMLRLLFIYWRSSRYRKSTKPYIKLTFFDITI